MQKILNSNLFFRLKGLIKTIRRMYDYAMLGRTSWDFDSQSIEKYMEWKLRRIKKALEEGFADRSSKEQQKSLKSLRITLKLLKRLNAEQYSFLYKEHIEKYGELNIVSIFYGNYLTFESYFEKCSNFEQNEKANKELYNIFAAENRLKNRDRKLLYKLLQEYLPQWWD